MIYIDTRAEYDYVVSKGYEPLINWRYFKMDISLRQIIQHEMFGSSDLQKENNKFYKWVWDNTLHYCEETGRELHDYSSVFISHIISKGADRRMAIDPRNINILSFEMHNMWEYSTKEKRMHMNIYPKNKYIVDMLKREYNIK